MLPHTEICDSHYSSKTVRTVRLKLTGPLSRMGKISTIYRNLVENPTGKLKLESWKKGRADTTETELWEVAYKDAICIKWYFWHCCTFRLNYEILISHNYCSTFRNKFLLLLADCQFLHDGEIHACHSNVIICTPSLSGNIFIYCQHSMARTWQSIYVKKKF
jgi:hypothetical protein